MVITNGLASESFFPSTRAILPKTEILGRLSGYCWAHGAEGAKPKSHWTKFLPRSTLVQRSLRCCGLFQGISRHGLRHPLHIFTWLSNTDFGTCAVNLTKRFAFSTLSAPAKNLRYLGFLHRNLSSLFLVGLYGASRALSRRSRREVFWQRFPMSPFRW